MTHLHWAGRYASSDKPHSDGLEPHEQTKETKKNNFWFPVRGILNFH